LADRSKKENLMVRARLILPLLLYALAAPLHADIIFEGSNPGDDLNLSITSDFDFPQQAADLFVLRPGQNVITDVHWWGVYDPANTPTEEDSFSIRIFEDAGGQPAISPMVDINVGDVGRLDTGLEFLNSDIYEYWVDIPPTAVPAGVTHWLSIVNNTPSDADDNWRWLGDLDTVSAHTVRFRGNDNDAWDGSVTPFIMAFNLTNDNIIPEPATATLGLLALGGLGVLTRRRRGT
jgi:uncharacterized protein (TIGR03382 family)